MIDPKCFFSIANQPKTSANLIFLFNKNISLRNFFWWLFTEKEPSIPERIEVKTVFIPIYS
jgi:hypothetical protein